MTNFEDYRKEFINRLPTGVANSIGEVSPVLDAIILLSYEQSKKIDFLYDQLTIKTPTHEELDERFK